MSVRGKNREPHPSQGLTLTTALQECLASSVLVVDRKGRILSSSPEASRLLQLEPSRAATPRSSLLPAPLQRVIRDVASTGSAVTGRRVKLLGPEGDLINLNVIAALVESGSGFGEIVLVLNDFTAAQRLEGKIQRLDRLASIGTLSASMAHEIKNALVSVKTFVDLLLEKNRDAELSDVVHRELRRMDAMVVQMLKFAGPARSSFSTVRVHDILEHSLRMVHQKLNGKLIAVNRSFRAIPDAIKGDDYQLEQAFVNLFLNAVEAMNTSGSLTVATETVLTTPPLVARGEKRETPHVRVTISDTGVGVTTENMNHLFEPFFTTKHDGTGLGLPITQRIIKEHHGDISVHSEPNKGTTFNILLPANAKPH
jgi:signal transduction histidine kinase